ncbi:phage lysozyme family protein [Burkholderia sp. MSHR3999]|uniref:glycoside hydrolase family 24 protein n=1 Tax=Burkholderia sp. MSHR3999 TaxID=1542965 RepID=UPI0005ABFB65|nr:glycoside hydrolase family 104 protein [Burkholderia sp. MSHR3999]KIP18021.1 phage lysozyme family protein [Burkholderia sp. MSHR3999]
MARITSVAAAAAAGIATGGQNIIAFLDMIAASEIGPALLAASDDGYNVLVGSTPAKPLLFSSYASHPDVYNAQFNSTAAGRYQELNRYALAYMKSLHLPDFGPVSQDRIAIQQIRERSAIPLIVSGNITAAISACSNIWASLPGNGYGQHQNDVSMLVASFQQAGGTVSIA